MKLLKNGKSVKLHVRNLHYLVTEVCKVKNNISPEIMTDIFHFQEYENYNLRSGTHLASRNMSVWERDGIKLRSQNMATIARGT